MPGQILRAICHPREVSSGAVELLTRVICQCESRFALRFEDKLANQFIELGFLCTDIDWLENRGEWANLNAIGMVRSRVSEGDNESEFTRYFITSLTDINEFSYAVRKHWSIENRLHWCLDVIFREDSARARKDNSPLNMNVLRKTALSLLNKAKYGRLSKQRMMFKASLNPDVLLSVLLSAKK